MQETLASYLGGQYQTDKRHVEEIEKHLENVCETLLSISREYELSPRLKLPGWPSVFPPNKKAPTPRAKNGKPIPPSLTLAPLLVATVKQLLANADVVPWAGVAAPSSGRYPPPKFLSQKLVAKLNMALSRELELMTDIASKTKEIYQRWCKGNADTSYRNQWATTAALHPSGIWSHTYGADDPITMASLIDACRGEDMRRYTALRRAKVNSWRRLVKKLAETEGGKKVGYAPDALPWHRVLRSGTGEPTDSVFTAVRVARLLRGADVDDAIKVQEKWYPRLAHYFQYKINDQLTYKDLRDSRFDIGELAFALEGLLICNRGAATTSLFIRVMTVLNEYQQRQGNWISTVPYLSEGNGKVLVPSSLEIAVSVLSCCQLFDMERSNDFPGLAFTDMLAERWIAMRTRGVELQNGRGVLRGWPSDTRPQPDQIDFWETALAAQFMVHMRALLQRRMAHRCLELSGLRFTFPDNIRRRETIDDENVDLLDFQGYRIIDADLVDGNWDDDKCRSVLLYGPPGTGKSSLAKFAAARKNLPFILVTVSDFLTSDGASVEPRAKALFEVLRVQPRSIILFDEFDQFLLDRDTELFYRQESLYQFLTPGMLTKLQDLRENGNSYFFVATNYADRIDAAIKRTGRIDKKIALLPPDRRTRRRYMAEHLEKAFGLNERNSASAQRGEVRIWTPSQREAAWSVFRQLNRSADRESQSFDLASLHLSHTDLENVCSETIKLMPKGGAWSAEKLLAALTTQAEKVNPAVSLQSYLHRLLDSKNRPLPLDKTPMREFLALVALEVEVTGYSKRQQQRDGAKALRAAQSVLKSDAGPGGQARHLGIDTKKNPTDFLGIWLEVFDRRPKRRIQKTTPRRHGFMASSVPARENRQ